MLISGVFALCRYYWEQLFPTTDEALAAHYNGSGARDNRVAQVNPDMNPDAKPKPSPDPRLV